MRTNMAAFANSRIWTNGIGYNNDPSTGKPCIALPAFVPVAFELTILFSSTILTVPAFLACLV